MANYNIEVVLRERDYAITEHVTTARNAREWNELDVEDVLRDILRAIDRAKNPEDATDRHIALRGFSWIVEPTAEGVVIAIEIPMGAAVAGPFDVDQATLDALITTTLKRQPTTALLDPTTPVSPTIH